MKTVLCHGVFDILHAGHLAYFKAAKAFGDYLVVSVTTDQHVNKGPGRPYFTTAKRAEMLEALEVVDKVVISNHASAVPIINEVKPHFYVKGPDYKDLTKDVTGEIYNEKAAVESHGGKLVFTDEETFSSSTIINRFFQGWSDEQKAQIEKVQENGGLVAIEHALQVVEKLKVLVVGEPIIDVYRFVQPEGISSKSPTISARFLYEEDYEGGVDAIYNHLNTFTNLCDPIIGSTQTKIRYISGQQRVFEVTEIQEKHDRARLAEKMLMLAKTADVVILADFGHGLFEGEMLQACFDMDTKFVGLNVQTNSSNYGFNIYRKHERWDYLCLDTREARLAEHDKNVSPLNIGNKVWLENHKKNHVSITLGSGGSCLWTDGKEILCPAFADNIIDAVGAGDCYFSISTCLLASGCKPELVPFISNVAAGLKCKIIGNKSAVSKASLLKAIQGILK